MPKLSAHAVDAGKAVDGVEYLWPEGRPRDEQFRFVIARMHNPRFRAELQRLSQPYLQEVRDGKLDKDLQIHLFDQAASTTVFLELHDSLEEDGSPTPDTPEQRYHILHDAAFGEMSEAILQYARSSAAYAVEVLEESAGNSASSSSGNSDTEQSRSTSEDGQPVVA